MGALWAYASATGSRWDPAGQQPDHHRCPRPDLVDQHPGLSVLWAWGSGHWDVKCCWCNDFQEPLALILAYAANMVLNNWISICHFRLFHACLKKIWSFFQTCMHGTIYNDQPRMTFPTLVANASPLTILPQFVEVLGKKLDKINAELDRTCTYSMCMHVIIWLINISIPWVCPNACRIACELWIRKLLKGSFQCNISQLAWYY